MTTHQSLDTIPICLRDIARRLAQHADCTDAEIKPCWRQPALAPGDQTAMSCQQQNGATSKLAPAASWRQRRQKTFANASQFQSRRRFADPDADPADDRTRAERLQIRPSRTRDDRRMRLSRPFWYWRARLRRLTPMMCSPEKHRKLAGFRREDKASAKTCIAA